MHGAWAGRTSSILGVWAVPAAGKTLPKGWPLRGPPVERGLRAAGAAKATKICDLRPAQKPCIKNPSVVALKLIIIVILVFGVLGWFPAKLGPGTP